MKTIILMTLILSKTLSCGDLEETASLMEERLRKSREKKSDHTTEPSSPVLTEGKGLPPSDPNQCKWKLADYYNISNEYLECSAYHMADPTWSDPCAGWNLLCDAEGPKIAAKLSCEVIQESGENEILLYEHANFKLATTDSHTLVEPQVNNNQLSVIQRKSLTVGTTFELLADQGEVLNLCNINIQSQNQAQDAYPNICNAACNKLPEPELPQGCPLPMCQCN